MKLYEPRRCIGQRKNGTPCSFLSFFFVFSLTPRSALFTFAGTPRSTPESVRGQTVFFFAPLLCPKIFVSDSGRRFFSVERTIRSLSLSFPTRTRLLSSFSATLLIFNWNQRSVQILDWTVRRMGTFGEIRLVSTIFLFRSYMRGEVDVCRWTGKRNGNFERSAAAAFTCDISRVRYIPSRLGEILNINDLNIIKY